MERKRKHVKTFKYEHATVNVHYDELPSKDDWIKCCSIIMEEVFEREKADLAESTSNN